VFWEVLERGRGRERNKLFYATLYAPHVRSGSGRLKGMIATPHPASAKRAGFTTLKQNVWLDLREMASSVEHLAYGVIGIQQKQRIKRRDARHQSAAAPKLTTITMNGLVCCPHFRLMHRQEPQRLFDLRNFGPRVEAREGRNEQFAGDLISTGRFIELCKRQCSA
jgi:hypothetical protein